MGLKTCLEISARHKGILGCDFLSASPKAVQPARRAASMACRASGPCMRRMSRLSDLRGTGLMLAGLFTNKNVKHAAGKPVERHGARRSPVPENITAIGKGQALPAPSDGRVRWIATSVMDAAADGCHEKNKTQFKTVFNLK
ncbi:hypothetical protein RAA17_11095 [Komagataeibacter rhaeticus]|nr:hypothetical protein [Komagataeibacter rhaeticus]